MAVMASRIRFISPPSGEVAEDDLFPALFAETHPLPAAAPVARQNVRRLPLKVERTNWIAAQKERVA
jgi:hypothetical protein